MTFQSHIQTQIPNVNVSNIGNEIVAKIDQGNLTRALINSPPVQQILKLITAVFGSIIILWLIIRLVSFISNRRMKKEIFVTYATTKEIKKEIEEIKKKLSDVVNLLKEVIAEKATKEKARKAEIKKQQKGKKQKKK